MRLDQLDRHETGHFIHLTCYDTFESDELVHLVEGSLVLTNMDSKIVQKKNTMFT